MQIQNYWLKEIVFKGTWNEFEQLAKALDFYNDDVEVIREAIAKLANIAKKGLDTLNESTFEKILFTAFTYSKGASQYKIATQASSGEGFLDLVIYFSDRADIYELKFDPKDTVYNVDTTLKSALDQIYKKNYMATVMHKIKEEKSKISVESIKLIPMLLHKMGSEADYQCQVGEVKEHAIKEAIEISQERTDNISKKNIDKLTLDELKEKINKSTYNQKKALIKKLGDAKKENFTKEEALKALNYKSSAAGYKLVENFFNGNKAANQSKKKKGLTDEFTQKKSHDLTYHSGELDWVLKERMQQENISQKVMRLDTHKSYEYDSVSESVSNLLRKVENVLLQNNALVIIVPYAEEEHFIGLIFQLSKEGALFVNYMDSENNEPEVEVKEEILKRNVTINKIIVSEQKYSDNCGIETIENFIGYLKAEDLASRNISQDEAIEIHKVLRGSETPNNPFLNEGSAKTLEDTISMFERLGIEKPKKRTWKEFKEMHGIKDDSPYMMKRMLKKAIPNNKNLDDFFKKFKGSEGLDGMTQREIEENLQMLMSSYKLSSMGDIVISKGVLNLSNINTKINQWINKVDEKKYSATVKLENEEGQLHAILLQIERMNNIFKIKIIDPLSENESKFTKEIIELENKLSQYSGILYKNYANKQDGEHATCGDTCLIMMQEYLEEGIGLPIQYRAPLFTVLINDYNYFAMNLKLQAQAEYYRSTGIIFETLQRATDNNQVALGDLSFTDKAEDYILALLSNNSNYNTEFDFNEIDISYNADLITINFISEKLRAQIEFANSTGIVFETLQNAIDNNHITSVDLPFLYNNARMQNCNVESPNPDITSLITNQDIKNIRFISLAITSLYTKEVGVNFDTQSLLSDELLINPELNNLNSLFLIDS